jgi:hypothetical protein
LASTNWWDFIKEALQNRDFVAPASREPLRHQGTIGLGSGFSELPQLVWLGRAGGNEGLPPIIDACQIAAGKHSTTAQAAGRLLEAKLVPRGDGDTFQVKTPGQAPLAVNGARIDRFRKPSDCQPNPQRQE